VAWRRLAHSRRLHLWRSWTSDGASSFGGGRSWRSGRGCCCSACSPCPTSSSRRFSRGWTPWPHHARAGGAAVAGGGAGLVAPALAHESASAAPARDVCTSVARQAWAKADGCPWGELHWSVWTNRSALAAAGGHLEAMRWARQHGCPWGLWMVVHSPLRAGTWRCCRGRGSATAHGTRRYVTTPLRAGAWRCCGCPRAHGCPWIKRYCVAASWHHPETRAWVQQQRE